MNRRGFSLIELLIALAVLALSVAAGYQALRAGRLRLDQLAARADIKAQESALLAALARDIRSAELIEPADAQFLGRADGLDFFRSTESGEEHLVYTVEREGDSGAVAVSRQPVDGPRVQLCSSVSHFTLRYYDGAEWRDQWGWDDEHDRPVAGIRGLPLLVSVQIELRHEREQLERTMVIPVMTSLLNRRA